MPSRMTADDANPGFHGFYYLCKEGGTTFYAYHFIEQCEWDPNYDGWNGKFTVHNSQKIKNAVITICPWANGGSFEEEVPGLGTATVTRDKSDAAWNAHFTGYEPISPSTFTHNCYGYSTGLGYNVLDWDVIKDNDLTEPITSVSDCVSGTIIKKLDEDHSIKIEFI